MCNLICMHDKCVDKSHKYSIATQLQNASYKIRDNCLILNKHATEVVCVCSSYSNVFIRYATVVKCAVHAVTITITVATLQTF